MSVASAKLSRRGRPWDEESIRSALGEFLQGWEVWPTYEQFIQGGGKGLRDALARIGGVQYWAKEMGLPGGDRPLGGVRHWTDEKIHATLAGFFGERRDWPSQREFDEAGLHALREALRHYGGPERWAKDMGVVLVPGTARSTARPRAPAQPSEKPPRKWPPWDEPRIASELEVFLLLAVVAWVSPSQALGVGSYQVSACNFAPEAANNSWTWATNDPAQPAHYAEHADCPYRLGGDGGKADQEGGLSTTDALGLSSGATPGTSAAWTFTAPAGTSITGLTDERYIGHQFDGFNDWSPALRADGTIVPGETCLDSVQNGETCSVGGPPGEGGEPAAITGLSAHELSLGVVCQAPSGDECVTGATEHKVWAAMYGATVTLSDPTPPTLSTPSGALWGPGEAGGFHKGSESVTVSADDVGGGVASIVLSADGRRVATYTAPCNFTFAQPCASSTGTQTLTLPTTQLSDGTHTLTLVATDAAGNQSTVASQEITVENGAPPPPVGLSATATQTGGSTFTATWSDPTGQLAPITGALYQVCPASGSGACSAPASAPAAGPATVTVPGAGSWSIVVWLTNAAGNASPANAAHSNVVVPPSSSGGSGTGHSATATTPTIHVTETLRGRELVVHVIGPASGAIRVGFIGRLRGRTVASGAKTVALKHGRLTVVFRLGPRTAAHALIRVSAKLDHELAVTSTLRRHRRDAR